MSEKKVTTEDVHAAIQVAATILDAIRAFGPRGVPAGELYAAVMGSMSLDSFTSIIGALKRANLVREANHLLTAIV